MSAFINSVSNFAGQLGIEVCFEFDAGLLVPEQRIRDLCIENKCGNYRNNYMCPPHVGSLGEIKARLAKFQRGVLLQYLKYVDMKNDYDGITRASIDFHNKIFQLEDFFSNKRIKHLWGFIAGPCGLCEPCKAKLGDSCFYPNRARVSLESIAIDVLALLNKFGLDNKFYTDKIILTGCILF